MPRITNEILYNELKHVNSHLKTLNGQVAKNTKANIEQNVRLSKVEKLIDSSPLLPNTEEGAGINQKLQGYSGSLMLVVIAILVIAIVFQVTGMDFSGVVK